MFCFIVSITRTQIPQSQNQTIKSMKTNHLLTVIVLIFVGTSCSSTKTTTTQSSSTTKTNTETRVSAINQSKIAEESLTVSKPPKVRPYIDPALATENLAEIRSYIDDLSRWNYVERVISPYQTIDEAINQDSIKILHRTIASYSSIANKSEGDAARLKGALEFLLLKNADVDLLNDDGEDALCAFLKLGSSSSRTLNSFQKRQKQYSAQDLEPIVKLFIANGADIKAKDKDGVSAFERIVDFASLDFTTSLLGNGVDINTALAAAIKGNNTELISYALANGAKLNTDAQEGKELFMTAVKNINDFELFKKLVDETTDINVIVVTNKQQRRNALHHLILGLDQQATQDIYLDKAVYLLEKGVKVIERDWMKENEENSTLVIVLANAGNTYPKSEVLCKQLIANGANVNLVANIQSPLFILLYRNFRHDIEPLFNLLIEKGADVNYVFRGTQTPLDLMLPRLDIEKEDLRNKATRITETLKAKGAKKYSEINQ